MNIQRNIRKLINGDTNNLRYLKYVNFIDKSNFVSIYPDSKSYFKLSQQKQSYKDQPEQDQYQDKQQQHQQYEQHEQQPHE